MPRSASNSDIDHPGSQKWFKILPGHFDLCGLSHPNPYPSSRSLSPQPGTRLGAGTGRSEAGGFLRRSEPHLHSVILLDRPACAGLPASLPSRWRRRNNKRATSQQEGRKRVHRGESRPAQVCPRDAGQGAGMGLCGTRLQRQHLSQEVQEWKLFSKQSRLIGNNDNVMTLTVTTAVA